MDSRLHPARDRATFLAWAAAALPRALPGGLAAPLAAAPLLAAAWTLAGRDIAARLALACAREQLVDADTTASAVTLRLAAGPLAVPLVRPGAFALHRPDLEPPRDPRLDHPLALLPLLDLSHEPATLA